MSGRGASALSQLVRTPLRGLLIGVAAGLVLGVTATSALLATRSDAPRSAGRTAGAVAGGPQRSVTTTSPSAAPSVDQPLDDGDGGGGGQRAEAVRTPVFVADRLPPRARVRCPAATVRVKDTAGFAAALRAAQPGDVIALADGTYRGPFSASTTAAAAASALRRSGPPCSSPTGYRRGPGSAAQGRRCASRTLPASLRR